MLIDACRPQFHTYLGLKTAQTWTYIFYCALIADVFLGSSSHVMKKHWWRQTRLCAYNQPAFPLSPKTAHRYSKFPSIYRIFWLMIALFVSQCWLGPHMRLAMTWEHCNIDETSYSCIDCSAVHPKSVDCISLKKYCIVLHVYIIVYCMFVVFVVSISMVCLVSVVIAAVCWYRLAIYSTYYYYYY